MKLTKCINGHFYDAEKFSTCPHCAGNATGEVSDDSVTVGYSSDMDAGVTAPLNQNDFPPVQPQVRMVKPPIGGMNPGNLNNGNDVTRHWIRVLIRQLQAGDQVLSRTMMKRQFQSGFLLVTLQQRVTCRLEMRDKM